MTSHDQRSLNVTILNYAEVTRDARVFKQAKALAEAGHTVTVYCNLSDDAALRPAPESIKINRFRCFKGSEIAPATYKELSFLTESGDDMRARYDDYLTHKRHFERLKLLKANTIKPLRQNHRWKFVRLLQRIRLKMYRTCPLRFIRARQEKTAAQISAQIEANRANMVQSWRSLETVRSALFFNNLIPHLGDEPADVVHAHDLLTLPSAIAIARRKGAKVIYDAHEYEPDRTGLAPGMKELTDALEKDCLAQTDHIITVSKGIAELYSQRFDGAYPTLIYNTPALPKTPVPPKTKRLRELCDLAPDVPLVVYIGGVQRENRGVDKLAAAIAHLPRYHLVNIGPRKKPNDDWLMGIAEDLGVADRIHLIDSVPAELVTHVVSDASVAASASQNISRSYLHSMPNKLFEATFAGLPVCVPDRPDQREFVTLLGHGHVMDQNDPKDIALALRTVVENPKKYQLTSDAKKLLYTDYSWETQTKRLLDLYQAVTA